MNNIQHCMIIKALPKLCWIHFAKIAAEMLQVSWRLQDFYVYNITKTRIQKDIGNPSISQKFKYKENTHKSKEQRWAGKTCPYISKTLDSFSFFTDVNISMDAILELLITEYGSFGGRDRPNPIFLLFNMDSKNGFKLVGTIY